MKATIIAEIGINHCGDLRTAKKMIELAKSNGADVAKFQLYKPEKLLVRQDFCERDWKVILASELSFLEARELKDYCDLFGIEFMASAFDYERLGWLEDFGVKRHKIASRMIYDREYCEAVKGTFKPYLVSSGRVNDSLDGSWLDAQEWLISSSLRRTAARMSFLYCISEYPTPLQKLNFESWSFFGIHRTYDGFSDHTVGLTAAKTAIALGGGIVEKHFTMDRSLPGPDQAGSMTPEELKELCKFRDEFAEIMGG